MIDIYRFNMALRNGLNIFLLVEKHFWNFRMSKDPEQMHGFLLSQVGKHHEILYPQKTCGSSLVILVPDL